MATGKKTGGRDFQPGQSGNPAGRPPLPPEIREIKQWNQAAFQVALSTVIGSTEAELSNLANSPDTPALVKAIASIMYRAIVEGDHTRFNAIADRRYGKVSDKVEVTMPKPFVVTKASGEQVVMGVEKKDEE